MHLNSLTIKSHLKNYQAYFMQDVAFINELCQLKNTVFIIDSNVWKFHSNTALTAINPNNTIILEVAEELKTLVTVQQIYDKVMAYLPKKNLNIIAIGGGILQDIVGFVASTLYRGVNWIFVPTTLLAQTDSCIGAKTSLNYNQYKNLIGTFYPPSAVYIHTKFLLSQANEDFYSGLGEMAKLHIMGGEQYVREFVLAKNSIEQLNTEIILERILKALRIKKDYIESDEFDLGRRNLLNYGHCFGHALESATHFAIPHGLAVIAGMIIANITAYQRGLLSKELEVFIRTEILKPLLKIDLTQLNFNPDDIIVAMKHDKKNTGSGLAIVLCTNNYKMIKIDDLSDKEAMDMFNLACEFLL